MQQQSKEDVTVKMSRDEYNALVVLAAKAIGMTWDGYAKVAMRVLERSAAK